MGIMAWADTPAGYALYGEVPTGYTDLTGNVTASAQGSVTKDADAPLTFTGKGLSGSQYCGTSNYLRLEFNAAQQMSLTSDFALHIFIKKSETATGDVQICLCKNGWNANRIPWLIANSAISSSEYSEVVLKYADRNTSISWNSYGDGNLIGTNVNFEANEMMRICAANGEQFMIDKIFLEATYTEPTPGPGPEPEPDPEFDAPVAVNGTGYLLYGATAPCGYDDLKSSVAYSAKGSLALNDAAGLKITGAGLAGRICETNNYLQMSFSAQQLLTLDENFSLHIVIAKSSSATGDVQVSFCRNGWNSTRISYTIANSAIGTDATDIELKYTARNTGNWNSYGDAAALGSPATFPAAEILRLCAAAGEEFTITGVYLQTSSTVDNDAPTDLTIVEKEKTHNSITVTVSATDDCSPITYTFYNGEDEIGSTTAASGEEKDYQITGLEEGREYTIGVIAKDPSNNATSKQTVTIKTNSEIRYYFVRGGDLPEIDGVTMVDLRAPDNAAWTIKQFTNLTSDEKGLQFTLTDTWGVVELKPKAQALGDVTKASWYLKMKFETDATKLNNNNLRINIGSDGGQGNFYLSEASYDGVQEMTFALADAANTMTIPVPTSIPVFQLHANGSLKGSYFKVVYAYLTNDPSSEESPACDNCFRVTL